MSTSTLALLLAVLVAGLVLWLRRSPAKGQAAQTPTLERARAASPNGATKPRVREGEDWIAFKDPIPKGWRIYAGGLEVRGVHVEPQRGAVARFADGSEQRLSLEAEPDNPHDKNAIKVIGHFRKWATTSAVVLGHVPREIAEAVVATRLLPDVTPRLTFVRVREGWAPTVQFDLLIPKEKKQVLDNFHEDKLVNGPVTVQQKEYASFFGLKLPRGTKFGEARDLIDKHQSAVRQDAPQRLTEWEAYWRICEVFDDPTERREYSTKAVSRKLMNEAIDSLKAEGMTLVALADEIDVIVDRLFETHPELERED